jgi:hypothetical protein
VRSSVLEERERDRSFGVPRRLDEWRDAVFAASQEEEGARKHRVDVCDRRTPRGIARQLVDRVDESVGPEALDAVSHSLHPRRPTDDRGESTQWRHPTDLTPFLGDG